jgi:Spy/CpxP family protein refolding chaperone
MTPHFSKRFAMNSHLASFLVASSLALGISSGAEAQPTERGPAHVHYLRGNPGEVHAGPQRWLRQLDLSEAQRDQIFKIFHDQAPAMREQMKVVRRTRLELREAATAPNFDRARARQLADTQAKALGDMTFMRADSMSRVVAVLTPEQRTKLQQLRERGPRRERG